MAEPRGRPLRALALVLGGWVAVRIALSLPDETPGTVARVPERRASARPAFSQPLRAAPVGPHLARFVAVFPSRRPPMSKLTAFEPAPAPPPLASPPRPDAPPENTIALLGLVRFGVPEPPPPGPSRWSGSLWGIVRGRGAAGVATPQLGGNQAGLRLAYALDEGGRVTLAGRVASALGMRQRVLVRCGGIALVHHPLGFCF